MAAAGVPRHRPDHARAVVACALDMRELVSHISFIDGMTLRLRIGISSGTVIAGVIGRKKFSYDLWGDAVNMASKMEFRGSTGKIQITRATYELVKDEFVCIPAGSVDVKGKGPVKIWHVESALPVVPGSGDTAILPRDGV
jgi:guanylate cyclase